MLVAGLSLPLALSAASPSSACEAMSGAEYADPPEHVAFELPSDEWHVAFRGLSASYARKELVPPDETLVSWTRLISWHVTFGRQRFDLESARDAFLDSMRLQCKSLQTKLVSSSADDLVYEWWHAGCYDRPAQHTLTRLIAGAIGTHTISFSQRGAALEDAQRKRWLERMTALSLRRRPGIEGELSTFERAQLEVWNGEYEAAVERLKPMAEAGDAQAQELLARLHVEGWGVPRDLDRARELFEKAVAKEHGRATYHLARLHDEGLGTPVDVERAIELYQLAASRGVEDAQGRLGYLRLNGPEELRDVELAREWFERALGNGHEHARVWLGEIYERGLGVEPDLAKAVDYYEASARDGEPAAQFRLGRLYADGRGVEPSDQLADVWLVRAAMQGDPEARELYRERSSRAASRAAAAPARRGG